MQQFPKRIKKQLRELATQAHENELARELAQLAKKFDEWRDNRISAGELSHIVHQYDTGPLRDLYKRYNSGSVHMLVAYAVVHGILEEEAIPENVWPYIENAVQFWRTDFEDEMDEDESAISTSS
ncbi:MAG: hypothetical protein ACE5NP_00720 [Anaerolineae bacterium]